MGSPILRDTSNYDFMASLWVDGKCGDAEGREGGGFGVMRKQTLMLSVNLIC